MGARFRIYKKYWAKEVPERPPTVHEGGGAPYALGAPLPRGPLGSPLMPIFGYMESSVEKKS